MTRCYKCGAVLGKYQEDVSVSDAKWYIEQLLCGEYEPHVEAGWEEEVQRLLRNANSHKLRSILKEGLFKYWYGDRWELLFNASWIPIVYGDHTIELPLNREVIIIDSQDIAFARYRATEPDGEKSISDAG